MKKTDLGSMILALSGSTSVKVASAAIEPRPSKDWELGQDYFTMVAWLLLVEAEVPSLSPEILPVVVGTIAGQIAAYFQYGVVASPFAPDNNFRILGTAELRVSNALTPEGLPLYGEASHGSFDRGMKTDGLIAMIITASLNAVFHSLDPSIRPEAFYAMIFGLEKWARIGLPRRDYSSPTWDLKAIYRQIAQGKKIVEGGWLSRQSWPLQPFFH